MEELDERPVLPTLASTVVSCLSEAPSPGSPAMVVERGGSDGVFDVPFGSTGTTDPIDLEGCVNLPSLAGVSLMALNKGPIFL